MSASIAEYRFENGSVYKYSAINNAYLFIGKCNGRSEKQFIADYEFLEYYDGSIEE